MFGKILIANRGEIACRVMRTAKRLGVRTVAVFSDADRDALHVKLADEALRIGPPAARESYLSIPAIIGAAREARAEAIHPGYGFLSENEDFAAACKDAGIVFIGPSASAIAAMGDKAAAKALMAKAGVPLVPGYHGEDQDAALLAREAARIGFPVLIKPSAGGGGKGMKVASGSDTFPSALESAKREALSAFGDDRVLIEKYLERPRHVEIQVFGDHDGNVVHLFERDCSVQRRHQKVLEEAPAPGLDSKKRMEMGAAAVRAARAIDYTGAGTVEFLLAGDAFYFMEMNTRLQVEHPVTEMVTGLDLVEWQLRVAGGERLPLAQEAIRLSGHAIEARIYAEDPERDFLPQTGRLAHLVFPGTGAEVRVDTGVQPGAEITPWYDPMIAKLIVHAKDRPAALARLRAALAETEIAGLRSNVAFLGRLARSRAFGAPELDTGLIERSHAELFPPRTAPSPELLAAAASAQWRAEEKEARERAAASRDPHSPFQATDGWRANRGARTFVFLEDGKEHRIALERPVASALRLVRVGHDWHLFQDGAHRVLTAHSPQDLEREPEPEGTLTAPMPGKVIRVLAQAGGEVKKGAPLVILEAMKMEHTIVAPRDGRVAEVFYEEGAQIAEGAELLRLEDA